MKILQVLDIFSPLGGGVSTVVMMLSNQLAKMGHDVTIYSTDHSTDAEYNSKLEKNISLKLFKTIFRVGGFNFSSEVFFDNFDEIKDYDIIHFHSFTSIINIPITKFANKNGIPYIIDVHGNLPGTDDNFKKKLFHRLIGQKIFDNASLFIAETMQGKSEYAELGVCDELIDIIYPGFDTTEYDILPTRGNYRKENGVEDNCKLILFLGRIHPIKGIDFLVKGFSELCKKRDDVKLVIAGPDDGYLDELNQLIETLDVKDKILFTGFLNLEQKKNVLMDSDLFVQPSKYEQGLAYTSLEGLLCKLPIIATDKNGAAEDLKRMGAGILVQPGDVKQLVHEMENVLTNPEVGDKLVEDGISYIMSKMTIEYSASLYSQSFERLVSKK